MRNVILVIVGVYLGAVVVINKNNRNANAAGVARNGRVKAVVATILIYTVIVGILNTLMYNGLSPFLDVEALSLYMRNTPVINMTIETLVQVDAVAVSMMLVVIVPVIVDKYQASSAIDRVYVFGHRVHESMIGLAWITIGVLLILISDYFDRIIGIFYLIFGAFLIGRDHHDVENLSFIKDMFRTRPS